ncbi:dynein intermediate chain 2, ciliary-like isoform X2 [Bolinopsis microptera]|uniref:dynein intermediate chain 2, ciliary-like isoform X2 n=1 Tax=Bolinopsis microptera TaxID=2820187 RepID=UPI00307A5B08
MEYLAWEPKILMKPDDQLDLSPEELKEEFTRILTANNPHAPNNIVRYSFKERCYKMKMGVDQLAIHFSMDGNMLHKESDEGRRQLTRLGLSDSGTGVEQNLNEIEIPGEEELELELEGEEAERDAPKEVLAAVKPESALRNQFNYSERASQTFNNPYRERGTTTEPPPRTNFSATANQWEIFDAYQEEMDRQERQKEKQKSRDKEVEKRGKSSVPELNQGDEIQRIGTPAKIVERMVNQNTHDEIAQDFKYWEDASDEFKGNEGTLLPLWPFKSDKAKKLSVTAVVFNPEYDDMFAVGHGSYDFLKQGSGLICVYSLKNPSFPEFTYTTESGVMTLDFHPEHPWLMAVGFYDGGVAVYNLRDKMNEPNYSSSAKNGKHTDTVWQVYWQENDLDNNLNFFSISSDGRVTCWSLIKNELHNTDIILIRLNTTAEPDPGAGGLDLACGTCFDFHKFTDYLFLVGTEEGKIHKCSKHYSSQYLDTYHAHHMAVYAVRWNNFHPRVFASCSADWTVKIWDHNYSEPMFTFDLGNSVGDVVWSPYSATVFGAVTDDGQVHIFDLSQEKYSPLCQQSVVQKKRTKVNHLAFNKHYPVILVGDDRGNALTLKLSPNLRKCLKDKAYSNENEIAKMEKLLELVREPAENLSDK